MAAKKIDIFVTTRFHIFNYADELAELGNKVTLYSISPRFVFKRLNRATKVKIRSFPVFLVYSILFKWVFGRHPELGFYRILTYLYRSYANKGDVLIVMPGLLGTKRTAHNRILLDRASSPTQRNLAVKLDCVYRGYKEEAINSLGFVLREIQEYRLVDSVMIPSLYVKESFLDLGLKNLFYNPFPILQRVPSPDVSVIKTPSDTIDVGYVGKIAYLKGIDIFLEVANSFSDRSEYIFHLVGSDTIGIVNGLPPNVRYHGTMNRKELNHFYTSIDIFLFPSRDDGFGLVLTEASSHGAHIIASRNCGAADMKAWGASVDVVETENPKKYSERIEKFSSISKNSKVILNTPNKSWRDFASKIIS